MSENKVGRPTTYTQELAATILDRIANGESLRQIVKSEDMPAQSTVYLWLMKFPEFSEQYARAREEQADTLADEIIAIADQEPERILSEGGGRVDTGYVQWIKNKIDARKWAAAKLKPKKYGDKIDVTSDGKQVGLAINIDLGDKDPE